MDLARRVYSRDLKIAAMREIDGGRRIGEVARHLEVSPHLLERWRGEWQARGELAFPGIGRRGVSPALTELQRVAELERKIGQPACRPVASVFEVPPLVGCGLLCEILCSAFFAACWEDGKTPDR